MVGNYFEANGRNATQIDNEREKRKKELEQYLDATDEVIEVLDEIIQTAIFLRLSLRVQDVLEGNRELDEYENEFVKIFLDSESDFMTQWRALKAFEQKITARLRELKN